MNQIVLVLVLVLGNQEDESRTKGRFMESLHDFRIAHWDHEPPPHPPFGHPLPLGGGEGWGEGGGSWRAPTIPPSRIGTMNPIVLVLVLVLVLEAKRRNR